MAEPKLTFAETLAEYEASRPEALDERFTQPGPSEMGPLQQIIPEEETWRDITERNLAEVLGDDRQAFRRAGKLMDVADVIPGLSDTTAAVDIIQALKDVDPIGIGIGALGAIPGVNRQAQGAVRQAVEERLVRAQNMGFDISTPYYHGTSADKIESILNLHQPEGIERFLGRGEEIERRFDFAHSDPSVFKEKSQGTFFSTSPDISSTYTTGKGGVNYPVFLNKTEYVRFKAPLVDGAPVHYSVVPVKDLIVEFPDGSTASAEKAFPRLFTSIADPNFSPVKRKTKVTTANSLAQAAQKQGFKGMILENTIDIGASSVRAVNPKNLGKAHDVVVVIDPTTIRSINADFNVKDSADILKAQGGAVQSFQTGGVVENNQNLSSGGLMDIIRSAGDYLVGEDLMNVLPELSRAFDESAVLERAVRRGPSEQGDALTTRIEEIRAQPLDEGMAYDISQAQGLESLLGPELAMVLGATGPGKKGEGIQSFIELMKSFNIKPDQSMLDEAKRLKDLSDNYLKNLGKKNTEKDIEQTRYQQGTVPDDTQYPEGHPFRDWGKSKTQIDAERKAREDSPNDFFSEFEEKKKDMPPILGGTKKTDSIMEYASRQERRAALGEEGMGRIRVLLDQRRSKMAQLFGPERDTGLGSKKEQQLLKEISELERKLDPYYSSAELKDMDYFAEGGSVGRRAAGGGVSYKKGYYGKSYH